ncbi:MAG: hypothetical protein FWC79_06585 [Oscillospiraceae bacterium]|nr:hypothetical protein [Oscillospiraceae bacterium]
MSKENMHRNLLYNRNEKRVNDTYAKHNKQDGKEEEENTKGIIEDSTKYGEFVSSFHHWLPINAQKDIAEELEDMTKD